MNYQESQARRLLFWAAGFAILSVVLQVVGVAGPGWLVIRSDVPETDVFIGIWYIRYCQAGAACITLSWSIVESQIKENYLSASSTPHGGVGEMLTVAWEEFQAETILALLCIVCGLVVTVVASRRVELKPTLSIAASVAFLLSGVFVFVPVGKLWNVTLSSPIFDSPWALIVAGLGGVVAITSCLFSSFAVYKVFSATNNENAGQILSTVQQTRLEIDNSDHIPNADVNIVPAPPYSAVSYPVPQTECPESKPPPYPIPQNQIYAYDQAL